MSTSDKNTNDHELSASDFCFYLDTDDTDGDTVVYFCPLKFFRENGSMSQEYYDVLDEVVPADMDEIADNCYASSDSMEKVEKNLLTLGFKLDEEFCKFMESVDGISEEQATGS